MVRLHDGVCELGGIVFAHRHRPGQRAVLRQGRCPMHLQPEGIDLYDFVERLELYLRGDLRARGRSLGHRLPGRGSRLNFHYALGELV